MGAILVPVIAIDGPSASGKGTVAKAVARALDFHFLDSGALYRLVALAALNAGVPWGDESGLAGLALAPSPLEAIEALEQLRALWHGYRIAVLCTDDAPPAGVDTPSDLERVRRAFADARKRRAQN